MRAILHVLHGDILEYLAVVDVPDGLVIPDLGGQQDGPQDHALPVVRHHVQVSIRQQPLQVDLNNVTLRLRQGLAGGGPRRPSSPTRLFFYVFRIL